MRPDELEFEIRRRVAVAQNSIDTARAVMRALADAGPGAGVEIAMLAVEVGRQREAALWCQPRPDVKE